jgi:hypothetical protein
LDERLRRIHRSILATAGADEHAHTNRYAVTESGANPDSHSDAYADLYPNADANAVTHANVGANVA